MTTSTAFCSALAPAIVDYVSLKQALGRKFAVEIRVLASLDLYLEMHAPASSALTPELFASWCLTLDHLSPTTRRNRMRIVRNLCLYVRRTEPDCFVPDLAAFPAVQPARQPYIFSEEEIVRLLRVAGELPPRSTSPLRSQSYRIAVVLLYTVGLRRGELVRLVLSDYDPVERTLLIRASKFHKSRLVALSADAAQEMQTFLVARRGLPHDAESPLLVSSWRGLRARSGGGFGQSMRKLFRMAGIRAASGHPPRVHDLRHTHAVHALLRWYRTGVDVQAKLPALATSMGHVSVVSTAYYLSLLPPVAQAASDRFADHCAAVLAQPPVTGGDR
jgi:integrase/recombinase XerD